MPIPEWLGAAEVSATLAHFLWQGLFIAVGASAAVRLMRRASANARYAIHLATLILMAACLPATFAWLHYARTPTSPHGTTVVADSPDGAATSKHVLDSSKAVTESALAGTSTSRTSAAEVAGSDRTTPMAASGRPRVFDWWISVSPHVASVYLIGVGLMLARLMLGLRGGHRLRRDALPLDDAELQDVLRRSAKRMGLTFVPMLAYCRRISAPVVVGVFRPTILLPLSLASGLSASQIESIICHELAHIRRYDHLIQLFQRLVEAALFFHPAVWYVSRQLSTERENCCDDVAMLTGRCPADYAEALLRVVELSQPVRGVPHAVPVNSLLGQGRGWRLRARILRLIGHGEASELRLTRRWTVTMLLAMLLATATLLTSNRSLLSASEDAPSESDTQSASGPRGYQSGFRQPEYSLRDEPLRVWPRTLEDAAPAPGQAIVFGRPIRWWTSHWAGLNNTSAVAMESHETLDRFIVTESSRRKVWVKYFDVPIDPQRYPIAVLTYRARNTDPQHETYALYIDDGCGPDYGGLMPFLQRDIVPDGQLHVLSCDLRTMKPIGDLIGLAVGVYSDAIGPAQFDLIDLRFEAVDQKAQPQPVLEDVLVKVRATNRAGEPIADATVTIDAERSNWARSTRTNDDGTAQVVPYRTKTGRHMIRVVKEGMMPVEVRDLEWPVDVMNIVLDPATTYGGIVRDAQGQAVAGATVNIKATWATPGALWTRKDAVVLTNKAGGWLSPPMPTHADRVQIALTHPDYGGGPRYCAVHQPDIELLQQGEAVVQIKPMVAIDGRIVDEDGQPIAAARVRAMSGSQYEVTTRADGRFRIWTPHGRDTVRVEQADFAPKIVRIESKPDDESIDIQLSRGRSLRGRVVDPTGGPISDAVVKAVGGLWSGQTDAEGYFEWTQAPAETTALTITKPKYGTVTTSLKPADTPHVITLRRKYDPSRIFRRLSDSAWPQREPADGGQPVVVESIVKTT